MDQKTALGILKSGHNVLLTGSAGTGKTYVLRQFLKHLYKHQVQVGVTASTGLAATHLNGTTIHSWAKIGIKHELTPGFEHRISEKERKRMQATDVLVIDEISMLHDYRLDMVDTVLRKVREDARPFGGVQVVLCGDFFQLPPVNRADDEKQGGFIVGSSVWQQADFLVCYLDKSYRQARDIDFANILNAMRANDVRRHHVEALLGRVDTELDDNVLPTRLFPTNIDTDRLNKTQLDLLTGDVRAYTMSTSGRKDKLEGLIRSCLADEMVRLKIGAQVMFIKNSPSKGYYNGTLGIVTKFTEGLLSLPIVRTTDGKEITVSYEDWELRDDNKSKPKATISQLPLKLAWAITVHKSQGMTLDAAEVDLRRTFVAGMGYVALSRVRSLKDLRLLGINKMALQISSDALAIDSELRKRSQEAVARQDLLISDKWLPYTLQEISDVVAPKSESTFSVRIAKMRETHPNAFKRWEEEHDRAVLKAFNKEDIVVSIELLSKELGRQPGSIVARLKKHGLIEEDYGK